MILMREKCTSSRSRDCHGLFFMNKQRMCVWALYNTVPLPPSSSSQFPSLLLEVLHACFLKPTKKNVKICAMSHRKGICDNSVGGPRTNRELNPIHPFLTELQYLEGTI